MKDKENMLKNKKENKQKQKNRMQKLSHSKFLQNSFKKGG